MDGALADPATPMSPASPAKRRPAGAGGTGDYAKGRWHLWEFHDFDWCPHAFRSFVTNGLLAGWNFDGGVWPLKGHLPSGVDVAAAIIGDALAASGETSIVDLCSGSGGPIPSVVARLRASGRCPDLQATLTDLYPHTDDWRRLVSDAGGREARAPTPGASRPPITFHPTSVDATGVPAALGGVRTCMAAFHHLTPALGERVLADAVAHRQPLVIIELTERKLISLVVIAIFVFVTAIVMPLMGLIPMNRTRVFFTYIVPIFTVLFVWDGIVSCLRTLTVPEFQAMAAVADPTGEFSWTAGKRRVVSFFPWYCTTYLVGIPNAKKKA